MTPQTDRLQVGVLGTGRISGLFADGTEPAPNTHAGAIARDARFQLAGAFDPDSGRSQAFCRRWNSVPFTSPSDLMETVKPDVVVVAAPDEAHARLSEAVLTSPARPRVLILEKPPCVTRDELRTLLAQAARCSGTQVVVNLNRRFEIRHQALATAIASRTFGDVVEVIFSYYGGWLRNGTHAVDTVRMLLGGDLQVVDSAVTSGGSSADHCRDVDAISTRWKDAQIRFRAVDERFFQLFEVDLRCTNGRVRLEDFGNRLVVERVAVNRAGERELVSSEELSELFPSNAWIGLYDAVACFLTSGDTSALRGVDLADAAETMEVMFDAIG